MFLYCWILSPHYHQKNFTKSQKNWEKIISVEATDQLTHGSTKFQTTQNLPANLQYLFYRIASDKNNNCYDDI